jgi:hypothetical protein
MVVPVRITECQFERRPEIRLRQSYAKGIPEYSQKLRVLRVMSAWSSTAKARSPRAAAAVAYPGWFLKHREFTEPIHGGVKEVHFAITKSRLSSEAQDIIRAISSLAADQDLRDEGEPAPPLGVVEEAIRFVRDADELLGGVPPGQASTFYGEINVTWRSGDTIVRLACFPGGRSLIQIGSLSLPPGSYRSEENPNTMLLAARLNALASLRRHKGGKHSLVGARSPRS